MNESRGGKTGAARLVPEMASFKLLVLAFVRRYLADWGSSPSFGEIANGLEADRSRVRKAVRRLVAQGLLLRAAGPRGLSLPTEQEAAAQLLRQHGWQVLPGGGANRPLPRSVVLDYDPLHEQSGDQQARARESERAGHGSIQTAPGDHDELGAAPSRQGRR